MTEEHAQWTDRCPNCDNQHCLKVVEVRLVVPGVTIYPGTDLMPDGFEVDPYSDYPDLKDLSTEDEKVLCIRCKGEFRLGQLELKAQDYRVVWQIDVLGVSPEDAARTARRFQVAGTTAVVFEVYDKDDRRTLVDLAEEHGDG